jgi:hypothetical protein
MRHLIPAPLKPSPIFNPRRLFRAGSRDSRAEREAERAALSRDPTSVARVTPERSHPRAVEAHAPSGPGAALEPHTLRSLGARLNHDFSSVRVHHDSSAAERADSLGARAYTVGRDVVFGRGQFAPTQPNGIRLLTHELAHVVQQERSGVKAIQCDDAGTPQPPAPTVVPDPEQELGTRLLRDFTDGVALAFYAPMPGQGEEARNAAQKWATRESALGFKGKSIVASGVTFGAPIADQEHPLISTIQALGPLLRRAVAKSPVATATPIPPGMGPATVRTLAVFAHGTSDWCGLSTITSSQAAGVIKSIAPNLGPSVNVILYSCNAGREPDASEDWVRDTMRGGGKSSLASHVRDSLVAEGKPGGTVWGHTTTGHVSENFALREFSATAGVGAEGTSFVASYVFSASDRLTTANELLDSVIAQGFELTSERASKAAEQAVESIFYAGYAAANRDLRYKGGKLAESAPVHPVEVGKVVKDYWTETYWPEHREKAAAALAKELVSSGRAKKAAPAK